MPRVFHRVNTCAHTYINYICLRKSELRVFVEILIVFAVVCGNFSRAVRSFRGESAHVIIASLVERFESRESVIGTHRNISFFFFFDQYTRDEPCNLTALLMRQVNGGTLIFSRQKTPGFLRLLFGLKKKKKKNRYVIVKTAYQLQTE